MKKFAAICDKKYVRELVVRLWASFQEIGLAFVLAMRRRPMHMRPMHMRTADDLFGTPQGSPRTDKLIAASIQWAEKIMQKIDNVFTQ